jgi:hypothetical protein
MIKDLFLKNRSYRRFHQDHEISENDLLDLITVLEEGAGLELLGWNL